MNKLSIFKNISSDDVNIILKSLGARRISFKKDHIIFSSLTENDLIGIVLNGVVSVIKYNYFGNRDILDSLEYDDIFGKPFSYTNSDVSILAASDCEILFLDYTIINSGEKKYQIINENINNLMADKINKLYEKIELLSKRTIRDKLLCYFNIVAKKRKKKSFTLSMTYLELADYLAVDRSAMMRELKKLKVQNRIVVDGKKISINY